MHALQTFTFISRNYKFTTCIRLEHEVIVRQLTFLTVNGGEHFEKNHCLVLDYFLGLKMCSTVLSVCSTLFPTDACGYQASSFF